MIILHLIEEGGRNQIQSSLIWPVFLMYTGDLPACMSKCHIHTVPMETRRGGTPGPGVSIVSCHWELRVELGPLEEQSVS